MDFSELDAFAQGLDSFDFLGEGFALPLLFFSFSFFCFFSFFLFSSAIFLSSAAPLSWARISSHRGGQENRGDAPLEQGAKTRCDEHSARRHGPRVVAQRHGRGQGGGGGGNGRLERKIRLGNDGFRHVSLR